MGLHPAPVLMVVLFVGAVIRLVTLGLSSPWVDELNNWRTASESGFNIRAGAHQWTYICQSAGLLIADNEWGLRLYAGLSGLLAVQVLAAWAWRRLGPWSAVFVALLLMLSPFWRFYSADANHYAPLMVTGVLAAVSVDWFLCGDRRHWGLLGLAFLAMLMTLGFHPLAMLPIGAFQLTLFAWVLAHAEEIPPRAVPPRSKQLVMILLALLGIGIIVYTIPIFEALGGRTGMPHGATRRPGLNWPFWSALLADFFGALFHHRWPDILAGLTGAGLCIGGWVTLARRGHGWATAGAGILFLCNLVPFWLLETSHYFYPKFLSPAIPLLWVGVATGLWALTRGTAGWIMAVLLLLPLAWGNFVYTKANIGTDYQPTRQALEHVVSLDDGRPSILILREPLSARAIEHLIAMTPSLQSIKPNPITAIDGCGAPSIRNMQGILAMSGMDCQIFFTSLLESREREAPDFHAWLEDNSEVVAVFPSSAPDDFVPLDRDITLRRLSDDAEAIFFPPLPRNGADADCLANEMDITGSAWKDSARLLFPNQTGATYEFQNDESIGGLLFEALWDGHGPRPEWLLLGIDETICHAIATDDLPQEAFTLLLATPLEPGFHKLAFYLNDLDGARNPTRARLMPIRIDRWDGVRREGMIEVPRLTTSSFTIAEEEVPSLAWDGSQPIIARSTLTINPPQVEGALVVVGEFIVYQGRNDKALDAFITREDGAKATMTRGVTWTSPNAPWFAVPMRTRAGESQFQRTLRIIPRNSDRPGRGLWDHSDLGVYTGTKSQREP